MSEAEQQIAKLVALLVRLAEEKPKSRAVLYVTMKNPSAQIITIRLTEDDGITHAFGTDPEKDGQHQYLESLSYQEGLPDGLVDVLMGLDLPDRGDYKDALRALMEKAKQAKSGPPTAELKASRLLRDTGWTVQRETAGPVIYEYIMQMVGNPADPLNELLCFMLVSLYESMIFGAFAALYRDKLLKQAEKEWIQ